MGRIKEILKHKGYNFRERCNFYASFALPPLMVGSAVYFGLLQGNPIEDSFYVTLGKGAVTLAFNVSLVPIELGVSTGLFISSSMHLRKNSLRKEALSLEQKMQ